MIEDIVGETYHEVSRGVGDDGFGGKGNFGQGGETGFGGGETGFGGGDDYGGGGYDDILGDTSDILDDIDDTLENIETTRRVIIEIKYD